jgi:hypothetical protein
MKAPLIIAFAAGFLLTGCGEKSSAPAGASTTNTSTSSDSLVAAPANYLGAITKGEQSAFKTVDTTSLDKAIQMFNVEHGRFPTDLKELVSERYISQIPTPPYGTRLDYDASAGRVSVVKQ